MAGEILRFSALSSLAQLGTILLVAAGALAVASSVGASAVIYYSIPLSIAQRLGMISSTVTTIVFPHLSRTRTAHAGSSRLLSHSNIIVATATGALASVLFFAGTSGMSLWISADFARRASGSLKVLALGFLLVCLASVYQVNMEASGRNAVVTALNVTGAVSSASFFAFFCPGSTG